MHSSTGIKRLAGWLLAGLMTVLSASAMSDSAVTKGSKAAGMDACVAPISEMRRNHMDYLKHDRVETVRYGVRGSEYSLTGCVDCHAERDEKGGYKPINAEGQFCESCHNYVAVSLACFQCHSKTPAAERKISAGPMDGTTLDSYALEHDLKPATALFHPGSRADMQTRKLED